MYIESVKNRNSPPCILLRESYRQDGKVRKRTLANLTNWPGHVVEGLREVIKGNTVCCAGDSFDIVRSMPHGHAAVVLGTVKQLKLDRAICSRGSRNRDLVVAMIAARILDPRSKLATAQGLNEETLSSSIGAMLDIQDAGADELYGAMDWLHERRDGIENRLAARHLEDGCLVLYDLTSTYFEGRACPLARHGYSRDGKGDKLQIVFGLLCNAEGCPVAVEVFDGNTADPATLSAQIRKVRERFGLRNVVMVGDRGMITQARIEEELSGVEGLDWITALRAPQIKQLVNSGALQLSLFDTTDMASITSDDFPGERLIVCRNPLLAEQRRHKRLELLEATELALDKIVAATQRTTRPLHGKDNIGLRVGKVIDKYKMGKHFKIEITGTSLRYHRDTGNIDREAALDGIYIVRTSVAQTTLSDRDTVLAYKSLSRVERAFRSTKTVDLKVRPIYHHLPDRVRAHIFICMLAYYVEWHMRKALAPLLFDNHSPHPPERASVVEPAPVPQAAAKKARTKKTQEGHAAESFQQLLANMGCITLNLVQPRLPGAPAFYKITMPTPLQQRALDLLGIRLRVPSTHTG